MFFSIFAPMGTAVNQPWEQVTISRKEYEELLALKEAYQNVCFQLQELQRMIFGTKSERFTSAAADPLQLDLFASSDESIQEETACASETISYERNNPVKHPSRSALPEHLRREEEIIEPEHKPEGAVKIGEAITEILEYKPAELFVRKIIRPKYAIPGSEGEGCVVVAPMPSLPIAKGNAGASLLSHICISKFIDHLPFYRQAKMFKRDKIPVSESTIKGWFAATCRLLGPLYEKLCDEIKKETYLQADESPIPVLTADKPGATHKGYMWVYNAPVSGMVCFRYDKTRSGEVVANYLGDYSGALQTDAYAGYDRYKAKENVVLLGCAAHARRKFEHAKENDPKRSAEALSLFRKLYKMEEQACEGGLNFENRLKLRNEHSLSIMQELKVLLESWRMKILPKSPIGAATAYTLNIWDRLENTMTDGMFEIDNNLIENRIRPLALGRKNYLFAGSHEGAVCNAMMYSFFACCVNADVHPTTWLTDVIDRISDHKANKLTELLPHNWKNRQR